MSLFLRTVLFLAYAHLISSFFSLGGPSSQIQCNETRIAHKVAVLPLRYQTSGPQGCWRWLDPFCMETTSNLLVRIFLCPPLSPPLRGTLTQARCCVHDENVWLSTCPSVGSSRWVTSMFTDSFGALACQQQVGGPVSLPPSEALHKQLQP